MISKFNAKINRQIRPKNYVLGNYATFIPKFRPVAPFAHRAIVALAETPGHSEKQDTRSLHVTPRVGVNGRPSFPSLQEAVRPRGGLGWCVNHSERNAV